MSLSKQMKAKHNLERMQKDKKYRMRKALSYKRFLESTFEVYTRMGGTDNFNKFCCENKEELREEYNKEIDILVSMAK